ncbi:transcription repressor OFP15-like [Dioscorea cayenensis subsp. rotundata]|uniref:Transcription repressor n=1 Tax=Dioscorea cayennensis subsp. rotundata TaxID=55577 RepID=A0AB40C941_DIOCR|nr:transcription repressor OFP15-like [Dioscorea cayenensis subsp. rotundata]
MGKTRRFLSKFIKPKLPFFIHKSKSSNTHSFRTPEEVKEEEVEEVKEIPTSNFPTSISKEACFKAETIQEVQEEEEEEEEEEDGSEIGKSSSSSVSEFFSCTSSVCDDFHSCSSFHELLTEANNTRNSVSSVSEYFSSLEEVGSKQQLNNLNVDAGEVSQRFFFLPSSSKSIIEKSTSASVTMALCSDDPYWDFRSSMEAMVEDHKLRDHWPHLLELLNCYMKLNEKRNHRIILIAFMDLILQLSAQDS